MTTYLAILNGISWAALIGGFILIFAEDAGRPRIFLCDCRMFPDQPHHLDTPYLLGASITCAVISVDSLVRIVFDDRRLNWMHLGFAIFYALWSLVWYRKWKKHNRGGKHGSLARLLAKVKITTAGLKVVPVSGEH